MSIQSIAAVTVAQEARIAEPIRKTQEVKPPDQSLASAVAAANEGELLGQRNELTFAVDPETRTFIVRLIDKGTGDVVRQVPNEEVLRLARRSPGHVFELA